MFWRKLEHGQLCYVPIEFDNKISLGDNALDTYVKSVDPTTGYKFLTDQTWSGTGYKTFVLNFTSQSWQGFDVRENPVWFHELLITVPTDATTGQISISETGATLPTLVYLEGGDYDGLTSGDYHAPRYSPGVLNSQKNAKSWGQAVAVLRQVPPSFAVNNLDEGALMSMGQKMFLETNNTKYLAEFPVTKSVSESFKVIDNFLVSQGVSRNDNGNINKFALSGASKRGHFSYLSAAVEYEKVTHLFPVSFDYIRMNKWLHNQQRGLGGYSFAWGFLYDVFAYIDTEINDLMLKYIDPWCYRSRYAEQSMTISHYLGTSDVMMLMGDTELWFAELRYLYDQQEPSDQESLASSNKLFLSFLANADHGANGSEGQEQVIQPSITSLITKDILPRYRWWRGIEQDQDDGQYYGYIILEVDRQPDNLEIFEAESTSPRRDWRTDAIGKNNRPEKQNIVWGNNDKERVVRITSLHDSNYPFAYKGRYLAPSGIEDKEDLSTFKAFYINLSFTDSKGNSLILTTEPNIAPRYHPFPDCYGDNCAIKSV